MKITKTKVAPKTLPPVFVLEEPKRSWKSRAAIILLGLALALSLTRCSSLPPDIASLEAENARLRQMLDECEADAAKCLDYLQECETIHAD